MAKGWNIRKDQPEKYMARFMSRVNKRDDGCWEWTGSRFPQGYGRINSGGKFIKAHRESVRIFKPNEYDENLFVLHSCDNPWCVNPDHLRCGTNKENHDDMVSRGRDYKEKGVDRYNAKLNPDKVRSIRQKAAEGMSISKIAKAYGINSGTAWRIVKRQRWAHVE